jgi:hypothetical protein
VATTLLGLVRRWEVTLSRTGAKNRTRGRKLQLTGAKARVGRARQTRADLEQQLKACRQEIAQVRERLAEATKRQTATSEILRIISNSPSEIQSVLDAVAENAARLCDAGNARIWRLEDNVLRIVAAYGELSATSHGREGLPVNRDTVTRGGKLYGSGSIQMIETGCAKGPGTPGDVCPDNLERLSVGRGHKAGSRFEISNCSIR